MRPIFQLLNQERSDRIVEDALEVLRTVGMFVENDDGLALARERALAIGAAFIGWDGLTACLHGRDLEERLQTDADLGNRLHPESLPVVLVNGRRGTDFAPFLYAMVLTAASVSHPALDALPPPTPDSELP